jgi:putative tryptophan/tyrosine transport system substrate-binding protein
VRVSRRRFVVGASATALLAGCGRLPGQAQPTKPATIGFLSPGTREDRAVHLDAFLAGLSEHGYADGRDFVIEYRFSHGDDRQLPALAMELVQLPVDVLVASATPATLAAQQATNTLPIVMGGSVEPVRTGLIASLAHPGGNITGMSILNSNLMTKNLELLKETLPTLQRLAILVNPDNPVAATQLEELDRAAEVFRVQVQRLEVSTPEAFEPALQAAVRAQAEAILVPSDALYTNGRARLVAAIAKYQLPAIHAYRELVEAGGLMSYGPSLGESYRLAARYVARILKGTKPADLPVEQSSRFEFVVNLKTARELGIIFPNEILLQVTEVIQ